MQKSLAIKVPSRWTNRSIILLRAKLRMLPRFSVVSRVSPTVTKVLATIGYLVNQSYPYIGENSNQTYLVYDYNTCELRQTTIQDSSLSLYKVIELEPAERRPKKHYLFLWKSPDGIIRVMQKHNNNYIDLSSPTQDVWEIEEIGGNLIQIENPYERPHRNINDTNVSNGEATLSGDPS